MRKALILALVFVFVMAFAAVAVANPDTWNPPGPTFRDPVGGDSPHGTYATTGDECEVCHSPHQAGDGTSSYKLLRATASANACDYCHAAGGAAGSPYIVYVVSGSDVKDNLNGHEIAAFTNVPDTTSADAATVAAAVGSSLDCFDCHSVHGALTLASLTSVNGLTGAQLPTNAILKRDPGNTIGGAAANINEYCDSCHSDNLQTAVNGSSHYMGTADAGASTRGATALATAPSSNCSSCHTADGITGDDYVWPHNSRGEALMEWCTDGSEPGTDTPVTRTSMDANCLGCHNTIIGTTY